MDTSLGKLRLDHIDLFLAHWPSSNMNMNATLNAITKLKEEGLARAIGVCNFNLPMIRHAIEEIGAPIAVHQVEYHPFLSQAPMLEYLRRRGIAMTAYAPLAQGRAAKNPVLARIGEKHNATAAQIAIAWLLDQENVIAIPKAAHPLSQRANLDAFNINLDNEDRAAIAALPKDLRYVDPPSAPDWEAARSEMQVV